MFTRQAAIALDQRLDLDPQKLTQLMRAQRLKFEPNQEYVIPGGTLVTDSSGTVVDVWTENYTRILQIQQ